MQNGWIKLHRKMLDNDIYRFDPTAWRLFMTLLLKVDSTTGLWKGGRKQLALQMGNNESTIYKALQRLSGNNMVTLSSNKRFTTVYICKWSEYQAVGNNAGNNKVTGQVTTKEQQSNNRVTLNKNKEIRNKNTTNVVKTFGNADINSLISTFETEITPLTSRKQLQRYAAHRLLKKYPLAELERVIKAAAAVIDEQYAPQILSIEDLEQKLPKLAAYYKRKNKEVLEV